MLTSTSGALCAAWGIVIFIFLPNSPVDTRAFTKRERQMIVERMRNDQTGIENKHLKWYQVKEALLDYKLYILFCQGVLCMSDLLQSHHMWGELKADYIMSDNIPNGGFSNFGTIIIKGFGFSTLGTTLLQVCKLPSIINTHLPFSRLGLDSIWRVHLPCSAQLRVPQLEIPEPKGLLCHTLPYSNSCGRIRNALRFPRSEGCSPDLLLPNRLLSRGLGSCA
jgi:hypothetical protein